MSTFDGYCSEFPDIRIDQFRTLPGRPPPLAGFLSHVHTDHLGGLDALRSPFVYCSAATRELVLRLEQFPHRINYAQNIIECRRQTYKHLRKVLRALPMNTPTTIELAPGNEISVTLLDANHCLGAVMFLIEGKGKAILYTGDVRAEQWWIDALVRGPYMLPYVSVRRLDRLYLDTSCADTQTIYRTHPTKAEGLAELLEKVSKYPPDTTFFFHSWTFGYEEVWMALAHFLNTQIHLDRYRYGIYSSVMAGRGSTFEVAEAPVLSGFAFGHGLHPGILTTDPTARLHSCERGTGCPVLDGRPVVHILPIVVRVGRVEIGEVGIGGGFGDLDQHHALDVSRPGDLAALRRLCGAIPDAGAREKAQGLLDEAAAANATSLSLGALDILALTEDGDLPLDKLPELLEQLVREAQPEYETTLPNGLPGVVKFCYGRHASLDELRQLVAALKPRDIYASTTVPVSAWHEGRSMQALFGDILDLSRCAQDAAFRAAARRRAAARAAAARAAAAAESDAAAAASPAVPPTLSGPAPTPAEPTDAPEPLPDSQATESDYGGAGPTDAAHAQPEPVSIGSSPVGDASAADPAGRHAAPPSPASPPSPQTATSSHAAETLARLLRAPSPPARGITRTAPGRALPAAAPLDPQHAAPGSKRQLADPQAAGPGPDRALGPDARPPSRKRARHEARRDARLDAFIAARRGAWHTVRLESAAVEEAEL